MNTIFTVARNTFRETIRNKVLYNILLIAFAALVLSMSFGDLSLFSRAQVMADFGLATMSVTGLLLAVFIGVGMLGQEVANKTVYAVLTKPVDRDMFIFGKFLGLSATLLLNLVLIAIVFYISIFMMGIALKITTFYAVLLILVEMAVIVSAAIFFSTFTTPALAAIFTIGFYVTGHLNDLLNIGDEQKNSVVWSLMLKVIYFVLPNLEHFNIRSRIVYDLGIPDGYIAGAVLYGVLYASLLLIFSILIFNRKDL
ncbi:MAG: ABC transporter permease subunit [Fibrobacter sp.]|nr:ABC transporter permease subunit [Fibrobacter sp.]